MPSPRLLTTGGSDEEQGQADCFLFFHIILNVKVRVSRHFQPGEGPSRGLHYDCETSNYAKVCLQLCYVQMSPALVRCPHSQPGLKGSLITAINVNISSLVRPPPPPAAGERWTGVETLLSA